MSPDPSPSPAGWNTCEAQRGSLLPELLGNRVSPKISKKLLSEVPPNGLSFLFARPREQNGIYQGEGVRRAYWNHGKDVKSRDKSVIVEKLMTNTPRRLYFTCSALRLFVSPLTNAQKRQEDHSPAEGVCAPDHIYGWEGVLQSDRRVIFWDLCLQAIRSKALCRTQLKKVTCIKTCSDWVGGSNFSPERTDLLFIRT